MVIAAILGSLSCLAALQHKPDQSRMLLWGGLGQLFPLPQGPLSLQTCIREFALHRNSHKIKATAPWLARGRGGGGGVLLNNRRLTGPRLASIVVGGYSVPEPEPSEGMGSREEGLHDPAAPSESVEGSLGIAARPTPFAPPPPPCVTFRRVAISLRGPGQSPVLPFACCVGSLCSVSRCGRCSCWCRFRVRGAQSLVCWGCAECGGMCRLRVSGAQ